MDSNTESESAQNLEAPNEEQSNIQEFQIGPEESLSLPKKNESSISDFLCEFYGSLFLMMILVGSLMSIAYFVL